VGAGWVGVNVAYGGSSGLPGGPEGSRVIGVLVLEPEAGGGIGGGEVVGIGAAGAEGAADEEDDCGDGESEPDEKREAACWGSGVDERALLLWRG
jgi:hypothetical protein